MKTLLKFLGVITVVAALVTQLAGVNSLITILLLWITICLTNTSALIK